MLKERLKTKDIINKEENVKHTLKIVISLLPFFVASCTTMTPNTQISETQTTTTTPTGKRLTWEERKVALERIQSFRLTGKIAVRTPKESGTANVDWTQSGGQYRVALSGPLGAGGMLLSGSPGGVVLKTAEGKTLNAGSAEQLLQKYWGYRLPVSNLRYWVRGLPVNGVPYNGQYDQQNRLVRLQQNAWHIEFSDYAAKGNVDLPKRISITSSALDTKLIIYQWNI